MNYSPYVGPALLVLMVVSALPTAFKHARARTPSTRKGPFYGIAAGAVAAGALQLGLNLWIAWLGDGIAAAAVGAFLFFTRR